MAFIYDRSYGPLNALADIASAAIQKRQENKAYADYAKYADQINNTDLGGTTTTVDMASPSNPQSNYMGKNVDQRAIQGLQQQGFLPNPDFLNNQPTSDNIGKGLLGGLQQAQQQANYFNMPQYTTGSTDGMVAPGNIDIANRPQVKNPNGSISTVRSIGANVDGKEVLLPTIGPNGENWTNEQAVNNYRNTGQNLGTFATPEASDQYAQQLHNQQASMYQGFSNNPMDKYSKENNPVQQTTTPAMSLSQAKKAIYGTIPTAMRDLVQKYGVARAREIMPLVQQAANDKLAEYTDQYNQTQAGSLMQQFNASTNPYQKAMIAAQMKQYGIDLDPKMISTLSPDYKMNVVDQGDRKALVLMNPKDGQVLQAGTLGVNVSPDTQYSQQMENWRWTNPSANNINDNNTRIATAKIGAASRAMRGGSGSGTRQQKYPLPNEKTTNRISNIMQALGGDDVKDANGNVVIPGATTRGEFINLLNQYGPELGTYENGGYDNLENDLQYLNDRWKE